MRIVVVLALPSDAASIPLARHTVTAALEGAGVTAECVDEVEVALSEACTNAYRHVSNGQSFEVQIGIADDVLTVDVLDAGSGLPERMAPVSMPGPSADGGRGMALMAAFTDQVVFDSVSGDGGSVHLTKHLRWTDDAPFRERGNGARPRPVPVQRTRR